MKLYRYIDTMPYEQTGGPVLILRAYEVVRETPASWFIEVDGQPKRVLKGAGKRFAHEQVDWAAHSWRRRKLFQKHHLSRRLAHVKKCLAVLPEELPKAEQIGQGFSKDEAYVQVARLHDTPTELKFEL